MTACRAALIVLGVTLLFAASAYATLLEYTISVTDSEGPQRIVERVESIEDPIDGEFTDELRHGTVSVELGEIRLAAEVRSDEALHWISLGGRFEDTMTIRAPGRSVEQVGVVAPVLGVSGEISAVGYLSLISWEFGSGFLPISGGCEGVDDGPCATVPSPFPNGTIAIDPAAASFFHFGVPFTLHTWAGATSRAVVGGSANVESFVVTWLGMGVYLVEGGGGDPEDVEFIPVTDFTVTSESGIDWTHPIPEPATWALLAVGVGAVAVLRRRRNGPRRLL